MKKLIFSIVSALSLIIGIFTVSSFSTSAVAMLPSPSSFTVLSENSTALVSWNEIDGASKYELFYQQAGTGWNSILVEGTKHTFTDVSPYHTYYFQIRAIDEGNNPGYFSAVNKRAATGILSSPRNFKVKSTSDNVELNWDSVDEANNYELFYQKAGTGWKSLFVEGTSYSFTNINQNDVYYFQIRAIADNENKGFFSSVKTKLSAPKLGVLRNLKGLININWSKASGASKYYLWYKTSLSDKWRCAPTPTTKTYWNITNPQAGVVFDIEIHAVFPNNEYTVSNLKSATCLVAPTYGINYTSNDHFYIHWNKIPGAEKYELVRFCNNKSQKVYTGTNTYFEDFGTTAIGPYYYQVRALNSSCEGIWSTYVPVHYVPKKQRQQKIFELAKMQYGNTGEKYWTAMWKADQWCAMYAGWLLRETRANLKENGWSINVGIWADNLKKLGKWHSRGTYVPKTGDIIIFGTSQTWRTHVGIVIGVKDGIVYTSEGNATGQPYYASRVTEKSYSLDSSYIVGYGSVNY